MKTAHSKRLYSTGMEGSNPSLSLLLIPPAPKLACADPRFVTNGVARAPFSAAAKRTSGEMLK